MKLVSAKDLMSGMKVAKDVENDAGGILIKEGTSLNKYMIDKIKALFIDYVYVHSDEKPAKTQEKKLREDIKKFSDQYNLAFEMTVKLLDTQKKGKILDMDLVRSISTIVMEQIYQTNNILGRLFSQDNDHMYLYKHSLNVAILSGIIGKWLGLTKNEVRRLVYSGLLHDIGKLQVPQSILNKPGKLTDEEFFEIQKHCLFGYQTLKSKHNISGDVFTAIAQHHEREDGSGYPKGLMGSQIHIFAKILAVADVYDAMTSNKVYRRKFSPFFVAEQIAQNSYGILDTKISRVFLDNIATFYVGNKVALSDGMVGEIIYIKPSEPTKPVVKVEDQYIDLTFENVTIEDILA
ncbi:HD-GYP domain-containing protein [Proteinivorax hydrogeniformans]|uniref:HD-GYP domain-containing protein n=1 Tax=Proteinivorax hydrogeniformans TaxID=1826727 RepID=A0AAU8HRH0_9FIRM